ncbi:hypothetical protein Pvag_0454 [Pantoea vagans C9-1]|jgi:biofilm regulator BssS|nr:hypothetical protein [Pantoea sp. S62]ADO08666.1 hypothetical protein Pvag_0454 [Pantoea vagans C9-1]
MFYYQSWPDPNQRYACIVRIKVNEFNRFIFYPVTGWHIGPLSNHKALVLQFSYLDPEASREQAPQETLFLGLTIEMAKKLVSNLSEQIEYAENNVAKH